jgi:transcriptional regulator with XRE-family HTH domain
MGKELDRAALGAHLKEIREYEGYSQEDIGKYLGLPRSAISLIESGERGIDILELKNLAKLYKCSTDYLTGAQTVKVNEPESIKVVARATAALSDDDRSEVLRFVQFLKARKAKR